MKFAKKKKLIMYADYVREKYARMISIKKKGYVKFAK